MANCQFETGKSQSHYDSRAEERRQALGRRHIRNKTPPPVYRQDNTDIVNTSGKVGHFNFWFKFK